MMFERCSWDDAYKAITLKIRRQLLELAHVAEEDYTVVLMQGSGTFGVEAVLTSVIGEQDKLLIVANGAYGERMEDIARHAHIPYVTYHEVYNKIPSAAKIAEIMEEDIDSLYGLFEENLLGILDQSAEPKPYVLETVKKLREMGQKIGSTTGYTDKMMEIVTREAKNAGYKPDVWFSPDSVGHAGRPYPFMIFKNM